jgi:hypothetical protein
VENKTTTPASAMDEAPAANQMRGRFFRLKLRDFRFITI